MSPPDAPSRSGKERLASPPSNHIPGLSSVDLQSLKDEIKSLRNEFKLLRTDVKILIGNKEVGGVEQSLEDVSAAVDILSAATKGQEHLEECPPLSTTYQLPFHPASAEMKAKENNSESKKITKKAKRRRRNKMMVCEDGTRLETNSFAAKAVDAKKIIMGFASIALLITATMGKGGVMGGNVSFLRKQESDPVKGTHSEDISEKAVQGPLPRTLNSDTPKEVTTKSTDSLPAHTNENPAFSKGTDSPLSIFDSEPLLTDIAKMCTVADKSTCGCDSVFKTDYRGNISESKEGIMCEPWDAQWIAEYNNGLNFLKEFPTAGLAENSFCRNPTNNDDGPYCITTELEDGKYEKYCDVPSCDVCSCVPACGQPNNSNCGCPSALQADTCCEKDDSKCRCGYLRDACSKSLENDSTDFCDMAEAECCQGPGSASCKCSIYEQICVDSPSQSTCELAAEKCCGFDNKAAKSQCSCDFYTFTSDVLNYQSEFTSGNCTQAAKHQGKFLSYEKDSLVNFYQKTGGDYWKKKKGWLDDKVPHCQWHGLRCDEDGFIVKIDLKKNNLTGTNPFRYLTRFSKLEGIELPDNELEGTVNGNDMLLLRNLKRLLITGNKFSGHADMLFSPTIQSIYFNRNKFSSLGFHRFNSEYQSLQKFQVEDNRLDQDVSTLFHNIPHSLREFIFLGNLVKGELQLPNLPELAFLNARNNKISGKMPDFEGTPSIQKIILSNQKQGEMGGLTGPIPKALFKRTNLVTLDVASNSLSGSIPLHIGNLVQLRELNFSSNLLTGTIPRHMRRLKDDLEEVDLTNNMLEGTVPPEIADLQVTTTVLLAGNPDLSGPAPLRLCFMPKFDLVNDTRLCPTERNALRDFYLAAKGQEWTSSAGWLSDFESPCDWFGVKCNNDSNIVQLDLRSNGLSGTMSTKIATLSSLQYLDLSDNDMKGSIPTEIGLLSNLTYLRLSYNSFVGNETNFGNLQRLQLLQLHSNRISGSIIAPLDMSFANRSAFLADCGSPSIFEDTLVCEECTMCCNAQDECSPQELSDVQELGFSDYLSFALVFLALMIGASCALFVASYIYDKINNDQHLTALSDDINGRGLRRSQMLRRNSVTARDKKYALETIGDDSIYQFFLGKSSIGWTIVLLVMAAQVGTLFLFVQGAEFDLSTTSTDLVYTFICPRDENECRDSSDITTGGWIVFGLLMFAHLMKDVVNGSKMVVLSAKERHPVPRRIRFFIGGTLMGSVALFTLFVSAVYNKAIATSNTELIANSVIILFVTELDEFIFEIFMAINASWVKSMSYDVDRQGLDGDGGNHLAMPQSQDKLMQERLECLESEMEDLKSILKTQERAGTNFGVVRVNAVWEEEYWKKLSASDVQK